MTVLVHRFLGLVLRHSSVSDHRTGPMLVQRPLDQTYHMVSDDLSEIITRCN